VFDTFRFFELTHDAMRDRVEEIVPRGLAPSAHIPFTQRARTVLELSLREALALGDQGIGSEHILLGILSEGTGVAVRVLEESGIEPDTVREKALELRDERVERARVDVPVHQRMPTRGATVAMMGGFGMPGGRPVPRCSLCGRDEERCERVLVAGGVRLCSDCARAAVEQLDALSADAPKLLRFRHREFNPADKDAAMRAIERAFDAVIGPLQLPPNEAIAFVQGGVECLALLTELREDAKQAPVVVSDSTIERVRFLDDGEAEVSVGTWIAGSSQPVLIPAHAVREEGVWKVSRSTLEHHAQLARQFRRPPL
jgi:hypothetical protein